MDSNYTQDLATIRNIMEKRTKFLSLSGFSGVLAGIYALIGAYVANRMLPQYGQIDYRGGADFDYNALTLKLFVVALIVLIAALVTGFVLSIRKAKKMNQKFWDPAAKRLMFSFSVPLITGGVVVLIAMYNQYIFLIAPACLIFYGLALFSGGNFTFSDVKSLGVVEVILGLACLAMPGHGLLFWTMGFGVLHIIYGSIMYFKYER